MNNTELMIRSTPLATIFDHLLDEHDGTLNLVIFHYPQHTTGFKPQLTLCWEDGYSVSETFDMSCGDSFENWLGKLVFHLYHKCYHSVISRIDVERGYAEVPVFQ